MAEISAFRAYRYNTARVDPAKVLTQPYDKITPEMAERYAAASPYNLIPVEKGKALPEDTPQNNVYTRAEQTLEEWIRGGIIVPEMQRSLYAYFQEYGVPGTAERRLRRGLIALGRLEDYSAGVVYRHEQTLSGPKADRLELLRHTRTHTGQIFMLYNGSAEPVESVLDCAARRAPSVEMRDEYDVVHRLWPISDAKTIETIRAEIAPRKLVIADGHHRYETALAYRNECRVRAGRENREAPYEKTMMTLVAASGSGLTILPTHRVVARIGDFSFEKFRATVSKTFDWRAYPFTGAADRAEAYARFQRELRSLAGKKAIGVYAGSGSFFLAVLKQSADVRALLPDLPPSQTGLDVVLLHRLMLEGALGITPEAMRTEKNVTYERSTDAAIEAVDQRRAQISFLLNPVPVETVISMALAGEVMPQKSTDFFPKLMSGITMYRLED